MDERRENEISLGVSGISELLALLYWLDRLDTFKLGDCGAVSVRVVLVIAKPMFPRETSSRGNTRGVSVPLRGYVLGVKVPEW